MKSLTIYADNEADLALIQMLAEKIGLDTQASSSPDAKAMVQALEALAAQGTVANMIADPVAWQRETRQDRKLPYRDDQPK